MKVTEWKKKMQEDLLMRADDEAMSLRRRAEVEDKPKLDIPYFIDSMGGNIYTDDFCPEDCPGYYYQTDAWHFGIDIPSAAEEKQQNVFSILNFSQMYLFTNYILDDDFIAEMNEILTPESKERLVLYLTYSILMPKEYVAKVWDGKKTVREIAAIFGVTEKCAKERLGMLGYIETGDFLLTT